jgi:hypothetical protein
MIYPQRYNPPQQSHRTARRRANLSHNTITISNLYLNALLNASQHRRASAIVFISHQK